MTDTFSTVFYTYEKPVHFIRIEPASGPLEGGTKVSLVSGAGVDVVVDENDNVIPYQVVAKNPAKYKNYRKRELAHNKKDKDGRVFSECILSERVLTKHGLKVGDDVIVFRLFLDIRQNVDDAAPLLKGGVRWFHCLQNPILVLERKHLPGALVRQDRRADLPEVVAARAHAGRLPGTLHRRQQQADERSNDRDHHEQFDEREGGPIVPRSDWACREGKHDGLRFK